jgi:hypothetical protein
MKGFVALADGTFVGHNGSSSKYIYYSTDDGATWTTNSAIASSLSNDIYSLAINNAGVVAIAVSTGALYYATSYSATSATASVDSLPTTARKVQTDGDNFYAISNGNGSNSVVLASLDNGVTWVEEEPELHYLTSPGYTKPAFEELLFDGIDMMAITTAKGINFKGRLDRNHISIPKRSSTVPGAHYYVRVS